MIVAMKKLDVLLYHREKEPFLESLRELGVVHINLREEEAAAKLSGVNDTIKNAERVLAALNRIAAEKHVELPEPAVSGRLEDIVARFEKLEADREHLHQKIHLLQKEIQSLDPWGNFNPDVLLWLKDAGIRTRFFTFPLRVYKTLPADDWYISVIHTAGQFVHCIVFDREQEPVVIESGEEFIPPHHSIAEAEYQIGRCRIEIDRIDEEFAKLTAERRTLAGSIAGMKEESAFETARLSMEETASGAVLHLTGWVPARSVKKLTAFLDSYSAWYSIADPAPEDTVPIELKHAPFSGLFAPITKIFSLPDYFELDPTPFFAPFFLLFFSMALGDVGYGMILAAAGAFGFLRLPVKNRPIAVLVILFGLMTVVSGIFLNSFFGHTIFSIPNGGSGYFGWSGFAWLSPIRGGTGTIYPAMAFSIYLGIMQIIVGMILQGYNRVKNNSIVYFLDPVGRVMMVIGLLVLLVKSNFMELRTFRMGYVPLGETLASVSENIVYALLAVGLALLLLFNNPDRKIHIRFAMGFWELYNFVTGIMGDTLSYLRLFALGLAGGMLGASFNNIAFMFITRADGTVDYSSPLFAATILVLILGHGINLSLGMLGAFIHSLRLTFVEFYKNLNFKGSVKQYLPFRNVIENGDQRA